MALGNKKNIIVGAASIFLGPAGKAAAPAVSGTDSYRETVDSAANWLNVGFTTDGFEIATDPSYGEVEVDQLLDAAKIFKESMGVSLNTTFAEATLENLLIAWGQSDSTLGSNGTSKTLTIAGGSLGEAPTERGLIAIGNGVEKSGDTNAYTERTYHAYRVLSVEGASHSMARAEATTLPVSFRCLPDDSGDYGVVRERNNVA